MSDKGEPTESGASRHTEARQGLISEHLIAVPAPEPDLLGRVKYTYSSIAQLTATMDDVRIAFGDRLPPDGRVEPLFGVTLSHAHARRFAEALTRNLEKHEKLIGRLGKEKPLSLPFDENEIDDFEVLKSSDGIHGVKLLLKAGGERIFEGEALTDDIKRFVAALESSKK